MPFWLTSGRNQAPTAAACRSMPQHAAACRSARFWELLVGVLKHAAACRSMPQRAKIFTWRTFFFITCQTCEPFVAHMSQKWMVAQWSMYQVPICRVLGSFLERAKFLPVRSSLLLHRSSLFWCCFDMSSPEDTQTTEASQESQESQKSSRNKESSRNTPSYELIQQC